MKRRSFRQDKIARVYDTDILPVWAERFGRLLLRAVEFPPKSMSLNVACQTGYPALEMLERMDDQSRIIALEGAGPLLDVARNKAGELSGRRIFFRTEHVTEKLSFADDVYDVTFTNLGLEDMQVPPEDILSEFARVTKPGGQVAVTLPLRGTWTEFLDIYKEVLTKHDKHEILEKLDEYIENFPEPERVERMMKDAGLTDVKVDMEEFTLLFKSAREFFFAPVIEYGPLRKWKALSGKGQQMQDIFWYIKEAIDAYFTGSVFSVTVRAGCAYGIKPEEPEEEEGGKEELDAAQFLDEEDLEEITEDELEEAVDAKVDKAKKDELDDQVTDPKSSPFHTHESAELVDAPAFFDDEEDDELEDDEEDLDTLTDDDAPTREPHPSPFRKTPPYED